MVVLSTWMIYEDEMILDGVTGPISSPLQIVGGFGTTTTLFMYLVLYSW